MKNTIAALGVLTGLLMVPLGTLQAATPGATVRPSESRIAVVLKHARPLARQGNANAEYNLGVLYDNGYGVARDYQKAMHWYRKAAAQHFARAEHNLGVMYEMGHGVPKDLKQAGQWFERAARDGEPASQNNLAVLYVRGEGVPKDMGKAAMWAARAAKAGNKSAISNLPHITGELPAAHIKGDKVNIHTLPGKQAPVLRQAANHSRVVVLGRQGQWRQVLFPADYTVGWVADFLLAHAVTGRQGADKPTRSGTAERATDAVASGSAAAPSGAGAHSAASSNRTRHIGVGVVNVRNAPNRQAKIAFQAHRGARVTLVGQSHGWRHVRFGNGRTGWVAGYLLTH